MADNIVLNTGSGGDTVAADDVSGVKYQLVQLVTGSDGGAKSLVTGAAGLPVNMHIGTTVLVGGAGAVAAGVLRVTLASDDPAVAALSVLDDWDETDRCKVNLIAAQAGITGGAGAVAANTPRTTLASDDPAVVALQIIDDWDETDRAKVNPIVGQAGVAAGAGAVGATVQRITLASDDPAVTSLGILDDWDDADACKVRLDAKTTGGLTIHRTISAASTNATSVKASAGQVFGWYISNTNTSARYVKIYNKASAPTVGTDTPVITLAIPGSGGANVEFSHGLALGAGIAFAITTGAADSDTGAVAANEVIVNLFYK